MVVVLDILIGVIASVIGGSILIAIRKAIAGHKAKRRSRPKKRR